MNPFVRSSRRTIVSITTAVALIGVASFLFGCPETGQDREPGQRQPDPGQPLPDSGQQPGSGQQQPGPGITEVRMEGIAFVPKEVTIRQGGRVRWSNFDAVFHTVTSGNPGDADAGAIWASGLLRSGESFERQFDEVGEFIYFCEVHPFVAAMRDAKVIVVP
ncbi:MAG: plastocyanin/azurin family copper-binding protein [Phycisphaerae bacterium]